MRHHKTNSLWGLLRKNPEELAVNELTLVNYYKWLKNLSLSMFKWEGLPDTVDERYLEETLFNKGKIIFFKDETRGFLALSCLPASDVNVYGRPLSYNIQSHQYSKTVRAGDGVVIYNNDLEEPTLFTVGAFASRLSQVERTIDININAQKTPILILTDKKQLLTMKNVYKQYEGNSPVIYANKDTLGLDTVSVLNTQAPYIVDKLDEHKLNLWNEVLTFLGIQNTNTEKKERLIVDEVNANNEHVSMNANILLKNREKAAEEINKKFNLNVSVSLRFDDPEDEFLERTFFPFSRGGEVDDE